MTALITGASSGIGRAAAQAFSQAGYDVVIGYCQSEQEAQALAASLPRAIVVRADVANRAEVDAMIQAAINHFGGIDVVICSAGVAHWGLFQDMTPSQWERLLAVNLSGTFHTTQSALPHLLSRRAGRIITVSSIWGLVGASCEVAYSATKAGIIGLTKALAKELAPSGITVNCVAPGVIDTQMNARLTAEEASELRNEIPMERFGTPEEIAQTMLWLASEHAGYLTGQVISPNGGMVV